jgi:hypothetical protein
MSIYSTVTSMIIEFDKKDSDIDKIIWKMCGMYESNKIIKI